MNTYIFDFDGTLIDAMPWLVKMLEEAQKMGAKSLRDIDSVINQETIGESWHIVLLFFFGRLSVCLVRLSVTFYGWQSMEVARAEY